MIYNSILETIGRTPLVRLNKLSPENGADVLVKVESHNPGGSVKDRPALAMINQALKDGKLKQGGTIIEPTSGNTGIGLAMVGAAMGLKVIMVMPETMSVERRRLIKAYGAEIILTEGNLGMQGSVDKAVQLATEKGYFLPLQFENSANPQIHRTTTALEIIEDTKGQIDAFVAGVGTAGTVVGIGTTLKEFIPNVKIYALEPEDSKVLSGKASGPHSIQGIGANFIPGIYRDDIVDEILYISKDNAYATARKLAEEEGILAGISSGGNVYTALELAKTLEKGQTVVTVITDTGERYLSTDLFGD